jgi:predicted acetyltransferase
MFRGYALVTRCHMRQYFGMSLVRDKMLRLEKPAPEFFRAFTAMAADYSSVGETRYQSDGGWTEGTFTDYLAQLRLYEDGQNLLPGKSAQITYWLIDAEGQILGVSRLRLELNDDLRNEGGNIGYDVPPSRRRHGYGTELLRLTLERARDFGLQRVLVTCNKDNLGSRKIIEANGGVLESEGFSKKHGKPLVRYWIG